MYLVGTIRVQKSELDRMNLSTIQLADGSYVATLDVFHQLHCLVRLPILRKIERINWLKPALQDRLRKALNNGTAMTSEMAIHIGKRPLSRSFSPMSFSFRTPAKYRALMHPENLALAFLIMSIRSLHRLAPHELTVSRRHLAPNLQVGQRLRTAMARLPLLSRLPQLRGDPHLGC